MTLAGTVAVFRTGRVTAGSDSGCPGPGGSAPGAPAPRPPPPIGAETAASREPSSKAASAWTFGDHVGDAGEDVVGAEDRSGGLDRLGESPAVAGRLAYGVRDERGRLGDMEPPAPGPAGAGELGGAEERQRVTFRGGQSHVRNTSCLSDTLNVETLCSKH